MRVHNFSLKSLKLVAAINSSFKVFSQIRHILYYGYESGEKENRNPSPPNPTKLTKFQNKIDFQNLTIPKNNYCEKTHETKIILIHNP